ncbi:MAG: ATP-dependent 6-phosphofructokinase [Chloroflexi bacterium]|nr:ATP-dependent 6-phosphofructokinase [Anaerolineales bacterium]MCE7920082.1 6-phosphofructokinase [Chloroflexi bacterium CFX1]MCQ3952334.1 ATP-dependent 6-phosphofructokinase [Chloroflexota bacterium]MDL1919671.1 6-phosphofructokinase [Chloroflexi bacterium CFX5]MCK6568039.1 6-phosphofructokinase [Anaerolineales bacterium]
MTDKFTVGVLTSGGDAPGMNAAIRAVARAAQANNMNVLGVAHGFEGLINGEFKQMGARDVGGILQRGGTVLWTSRSKRFQEPGGQREAIRKMNEAGMDALIVIGGEGSMNGALALSKQGIKTIGIPASIDNDIYGTNIAIGTDTAMNTIMDAVDKLRDTASSHQRAFLIETMGRNSGYLAVMAGVICGAEIVLIPETPVVREEVAATVEDAYKRGKTHAIIINAEGSDISTPDLAQMIDEMDLGFKTRMTILGHIQRGGSPTAYDRLLASRMGVRAVEALAEGTHSVMTGLKGKGVDFVSLEEVVGNKRQVSMEYYHMVKTLAR